eukprot:GHVN01009618.1.p1 GENE.GHVN01009618.1~~GHVN01009618.1.p1  ORF type:complete len:142 (-),score=4.63 GHVN01009618.1:46-471(-)
MFQMIFKTILVPCALLLVSESDADTSNKRIGGLKESSKQVVRRLQFSSIYPAIETRFKADERSSASVRTDLLGPQKTYCANSLFHCGQPTAPRTPRNPYAVRTTSNIRAPKVRRRTGAYYRRGTRGGYRRSSIPFRVGVGG